MKERLSVRLVLMAMMAVVTVSCTEETDLIEVTQEPISFYTSRIFEGFDEIPTRSATDEKASSAQRAIMRSKSGKTLSLKITKEPMPERTAQATTRGAIVRTSSDIAAIGVSASIYDRSESYASHECGNFFYNERFVPGVGREWYWPTRDYKLSFYAYYPYGNSAFSMVSDATATGIPTYSYTVPEDVSQQVDVMTAQALNVTGGQTEPVNLTFQHHCAAIQFTLTNSKASQITVTSVSIEGIYNSGTLCNGVWTLNGETGSSISSRSVTCNSGSFKNLLGNNAYMFLLPQTLPSTAKLKIQTTEQTYEATLSGIIEAATLYHYNIEITPLTNYLRFIAEEDGTFTFTIPSKVTTTYLQSVSYSLDGGDTWTTTNNTSSKVTVTTPTVTAGDSVLWKGTGQSTAYSSNYYSKFTSTGRYSVKGNIMSLLYGDTHDGQYNLQRTYTFCNLFDDNNNLVSAQDLELPATTLKNMCYSRMFYYCENLVYAPAILPATTLQPSCYYQMFYYCGSLTTSPELPATTLVTSCYNQMFYNCRPLTSIKAAFTTEPSDSYTNQWLFNVSSSGTFYKNAAATWDVTGISGIPSGWTVETYTP